MRTIPFGQTDARVPNIVAGMMRIKDRSDEEVRALYTAARDAGLDFFDHADLYGGQRHACERRFASALNLRSSEREEITLQTKTGIAAEEWHYNSSYDHIVTSVQESLEALGTDYVDVLLLHRPDALVEPEEVARAFDDLESSRKVRAFGRTTHLARSICSSREATDCRQPDAVVAHPLNHHHPRPNIKHGRGARLDNP